MIMSISGYKKRKKTYSLHFQLPLPHITQNICLPSSTQNWIKYFHSAQPLFTIYSFCLCYFTPKIMAVPILVNTRIHRQYRECCCNLSNNIAVVPSVEQAIIIITNTGKLGQGFPRVSRAQRCSRALLWDVNTHIPIFSKTRIICCAQ